MSARRGQPEPVPGLQAALAELLGTLGFRAMAEQARAEADPEKLSLYARIIVQQAPEAYKAAVRERLAALGLLGS